MTGAVERPNPLAWSHWRLCRGCARVREGRVEALAYEMVSVCASALHAHQPGWGSRRASLERNKNALNGVLAWVWLGEVPMLIALLGGVPIIAGVIVVTHAGVFGQPFSRLRNDRRDKNRSHPIRMRTIRAASG